MTWKRPLRHLTPHAAARTVVDQPPHMQRWLLACCAADRQSDVSAAARAALWRALRDHAWVPTADDTPIPWATVQAWVDALSGPVARVVEPYDLAQHSVARRREESEEHTRR
jgi:hypothetical protein